ncbi:unnamed protein product, partial [marine sediment metagenome]
GRKTLEDEGVDSERILTLPLGADLEKFTFKKRSENDTFQILFVGGFYKQFIFPGVVFKKTERGAFSG